MTYATSGTGTRPPTDPASPHNALCLPTLPAGSHKQDDFENHVLKMAEPPDRKTQDS